jgi:hypothetical protein
MRRLNRLDIWPPGGWAYEQAETGFVFHGSCLQELAEKIRLHRESNNIPLGDIESEIQEQIISRAPKDFSEWEEVAFPRGFEPLLPP